jgi:CxxC-x17-CxxC domain-containing protein
MFLFIPEINILLIYLHNQPYKLKVHFIFRAINGQTKGVIKMYGENRGGYDRPPREMHKATCASCGQETEVPFKPDGSRPVYCKECYQKKNPRRY